MGKFSPIYQLREDRAKNIHLYLQTYLLYVFFSGTLPLKPAMS